MLFIVQSEVRPNGYVALTETGPWARWLDCNIPKRIDAQIRHRLTSNLKHLFAGLELKAALIESHRNCDGNQRPVLFDPYYRNLILEFSVGTFSILEGLGCGHWLAQNERDGGDNPHIPRNEWLAAIRLVYDARGDMGLREAAEATLAIRDKLHQDRLGIRENIDWHAFSYEGAFTPARNAIRIILAHDLDSVPETSNLRLELE